MDWGGIGGILVVVAPVAAAGIALARLLLPGAGPAARTLAAGTAGTAVLVVCAQLLGLAGLFRLPWLAGLLWVAAAGGWTVLLRRRPAAGPAGPTEDVPAPGPPRRRLVALAATLAVAGGLWVTALAPALDGTRLDPDGQHYHLAHAARFAQTGRTLEIHHLGDGHPADYFPANDELLRAVGMLAAPSEVPGMVVNLGAAGLLLVAAWHLGRRWIRPAGTTAVTGLLLASPGYADRYAGWANNDWTALAFVAAAVALLAASGRGEARAPPAGRLLLAGAALGIAAGTKLTVLPVVAAVAVAAVVLEPTRRWRAAGLLAAPAAATGAWWYARNLAAIGTPVPGLPGLPGPPALVADGARSVASYLDDPDVVTAWFLPGLDAFFGPWWPAVVVAAAGGAVLAARRDGWLRVAGLVALLAAGVYLVLPTGAIGPPGRPVLFASNLRYAWPALLFGLWGAAGVAPAGTATWAALVVTGSTALLDRSSWAMPGPEWVLLTGLLVAAAGLAVGLLPADRRVLLRRAGWLAAGTTLVLLAGPLVGYHERATASPAGSGATPYRRLFAAADGPGGLRIGISGWPMNYGFYGDDLDNRVLRLGHHRPDGAWVDLPTCAAWRRAVNAADLDLVAVVVPRGAADPPPELTWAGGAGRDVPAVLAPRADAPSVRLDWVETHSGAPTVTRSEVGAVFDVSAGLDPGSCGDRPAGTAEPAEPSAPDGGPPPVPSPGPGTPHREQPPVRSTPQPTAPPAPGFPESEPPGVAPPAVPGPAPIPTAPEPDLPGPEPTITPPPRLTPEAP